MMFKELIKQIQNEMGYRQGRLVEDVTWIRNPHDDPVIRRVKREDVKCILFRLQRKWRISNYE